MERDGFKELAKQVSLDVKSGADGCLIPIEQLSNHFPYDLKRIYYIYNVANELRRGFHAHKDLKQLIVCVSGKCCIDLDDTFKREKYILDRPDMALLIEQPLWREMYNFSNDSVLLVLASEVYDVNDYIYSYKDFLKYIRT